MKSNLTLIAIVGLITLTSVLNGADADAQTRTVGDQTCLDLQAVYARFAALPDAQTVRTQVTDISVISGDSSTAFLANAIQSMYESKDQAKSVVYDGSRTLQTDCSSLDIIYTDGRADHYTIVQSTPTSLSLQDKNQNAISMTLIDAGTVQSTFTSPLGVCDGSSNAMSGTVLVTSVESWSSPLPSISLSTNLLANLETALQAPAISCQ